MSREPRLPVRTLTLTERQREVLALIASGRTNFQIATELDISLETVKYHVTEILTRLDVDSREAAARVWREERSRRGRTRSFLLFATTRLGIVVGATLAVAVCAAVGVVLVAVLSEGAAPTASPVPTSAGAPTVVATTTQPATPTRAPATGPYPIGTRTGIASVDAAIAAVESGDRATLQAAWHFTLSPCATFPPPGQLRCPAGVAAGTGIPVLTEESTDGAYYTRDQAIALDVGSDLLDRNTVDPRVYAVVDVRGESPHDWYKIVFASGHAVDVDDVGITYFPCPCQRTPAEQLAWGSAGSQTFILPPR